jgi:aminoglycoside phosphotransferase (APT) family kinase protein
LTLRPPWQRSRPPRQALEWVATVFGPGSRVTRIRLLPGSWLATHVVDVVDGSGRDQRAILRRWARPGWEQDPEMTAAREAAVLERLAGSRIPAPRLLAVDAEGARAGVPAIVTTVVDGRPASRRRPPDASALGQLAEWAIEIHGLDGEMQAVAAPYVPYYELERVEPPPNSGRSDLWLAAIEAARTPPASAPGVFIHRDYHPGNTLWLGDRLSGIVDWTSASWGPPGVDLGQLCVNLGIDFGVAVADRARDAYAALGGAVDDLAWWDVRMLLDWIPELDPQHASATGLQRLETFLGAALRRLDGQR